MYVNFSLFLGKSFTVLHKSVHLHKRSQTLSRLESEYTYKISKILLLIRLEQDRGGGLFPPDRFPAIPAGDGREIKKKNNKQNTDTSRGTIMKR